MSSPTPRPGIAQGCYPERTDRSAGWVDRAAHGLQGALARVWPRRLRGFVHSVNQLGADLHCVPEA